MSSRCSIVPLKNWLIVCLSSERREKERERDHLAIPVDFLISSSRCVYRLMRCSDIVVIHASSVRYFSIYSSRLYYWLTVSFCSTIFVTLSRSPIIRATGTLLATQSYLYLPIWRGFLSFIVVVGSKSITANTNNRTVSELLSLSLSFNLLLNKEEGGQTSLTPIRFDLNAHRSRFI